MDFTDISDSQINQDEGKEFELLDPTTGKGTGIKIVIAGPDSFTQANAMHDLSDNMRNIEVEMIKIYRHGKRFSQAEMADNLVVEMLAKCVLDWDIKERGEPVPFSRENVIRLIKSAKWVRAQIDEFAAIRDPYLQIENQIEGANNEAP